MKVYNYVNAILPSSFLQCLNYFTELTVQFQMIYFRMARFVSQTRSLDNLFSLGKY